MSQLSPVKVGRQNYLKASGPDTKTDLRGEYQAPKSANNPSFLLADFLEQQAREVDAKAYRQTTTIPSAFPHALIEAVIRESEELSSTFYTQLTRWEEETKFLSSPQEIVLHPSYQRIIGLGARVIPLILRELEVNGGLWFWALQALTGENPVSANDIGRTKKMTEAWLSWGRSKQYI